MKKISLLLSICFVVVFNSHSQNIEGNWHGILNSTWPLKLNIVEKDGVLSATFDWFTSWSNFINAPVENIQLNEDTLSFEFYTFYVKRSYKGYFNKERDSITGIFTSSYYFSGELVLTRKKSNIDKKRENNTFSKEPVFTRQDTLRGSITPERDWWDLTYYHLDLKVNVEDSSIKGSNTIHYKVLKKADLMQIDLQPPLEIYEVSQNSKPLLFRRDGNVYHIRLQEKQIPGSTNKIIIEYGGKPHVAENPPWEGGFTWEKDSLGNPIIATSCQGIGASIWWPNKDHNYDEVDSMKISVTVPEQLVAISNGKLLEVKNHSDKTKTYHWFVSNPINNYGVSINIGNYVHFSETFEGLNGKLPCQFYVLPYNLEKAKKHFKQALMTLEAFEHWFGPYPFYEDSYKLIEGPIAGMEHQSSIAYGNVYKNGYDGHDDPDSHWDEKFDYIIIHETAHEWFGNSITSSDIADLWIHEAFATYAEALYLEYHYGKLAGNDYVLDNRRKVNNLRPIIGEYNVNADWIYTDAYQKGMNVLHTLRQIVDNDEIWRKTLLDLNKEFFHSVVTSKKTENYLSEKIKMDLSVFFDQYLRTTKIPILEYYFTDEKLVYRWTNVVSNFDMPLKTILDGKEKWIRPKTVWTHEFIEVNKKDLEIDPNFYVSSFNIMKE